MQTKTTRMLKYAFLIALLQGCMTLGNERFVIDQNAFDRKYDSIKQIVIEEAANNGFGTLTSEIKPSQYNDWKGRLFFQLETGNGIDQLFVDFERGPDGVSVWAHGAGTRGNASSASKAIAARLSHLAPANGGNTAASRTSYSATSGSQMSVLDAQKKLTALGYQPGIADGIMGGKTRAAIEAFQRDRKLSVNGQLDESTSIALKSAK